MNESKKLQSLENMDYLYSKDGDLQAVAWREEQLVNTNEYGEETYETSYHLSIEENLEVVGSGIFKTIDELEKVMRDFEPDLRRWSIMPYRMVSKRSFSQNNFEQGIF